MANKYSAFMELINVEIEIAVNGSMNWDVRAIELPVSENESLAVLLHYIWMCPRSLASGLQEGEGAFGAVCALTKWEPQASGEVQDAMKRQGTILWIDDVLFNTTSLLTDTKTHWTTHRNNPVYLKPPHLIAQRTIFFSATQAGSNEDVIVAAHWIGLCSERVTKDQFIAALVRG